MTTQIVPANRQEANQPLVGTDAALAKYSPERPKFLKLSELDEVFLDAANGFEAAGDLLQLLNSHNFWDRGLATEASKERRAMVFAAFNKWDRQVSLHSERLCEVLSLDNSVKVVDLARNMNMTAKIFGKLGMETSEELNQDGQTRFFSDPHDWILSDVNRVRSVEVPLEGLQKASLLKLVGIDAERVLIGRAARKLRPEPVPQFGPLSVIYETDPVILLKLRGSRHLIEIFRWDE